MNTTEINDQRRHEIAGLHYDGRRYDIKHYSGFTAEILQKLMDEGFADTNETQNDSPTLGEILEFLKENPAFTAHGYIVSPARYDVRVSVEGVEAKEADAAQLDRFVEMFRHADEFDINPPRAWYD